MIADEDGPGEWLTDLAGKAGIGVEAVRGDRTAVGYAALDGGMEECGRMARFADLSLNFADGAARFAREPRTFDIARGDLLATEEELEAIQGNRPAALALSYLDTDRDFQPGRQRVARARRGLELEAGAPVFATAGMALTMATRLLRQAEGDAYRVRFGLSWRWLSVSVGDIVQIEGLGSWQIEEREVRGLVLLVEAKRTEGRETRPVIVSDPGRVLPAPVVPAGPTDLHLFEAPVPLMGDQNAVWLFMGGGGGWRGARASLLASGNETVIGDVRNVQARGTLAAPLGTGPETLWDRDNGLIVDVGDAGPGFPSRTEEDVLAGANLLRVGNELLQYCEAEALGGGQVRLSGLLRGRFGTGFRMRVLAAGEPVRLVMPTELLSIGMPKDSAGRQLVVLASGRGDPVGGTEAEYVVEGLSISPMAPVHVRAGRDADGSLWCSWTQRSQKLWDWGSSEPTDSGWLLWFHARDGRKISILAQSSRITLSIPEQVDLLGEPFGSGVLIVEAVGDGPLDLRQSLSVTI